MKIVNQSAELLWATPDAEQEIEAAGRTCYKSEDKITPDSAPKFIEMVCKRQHESVLEHAVASFRIVCDRGVSHEIVRHRICSISQESTRYVNYSKGKFGGEITVIEPPGMTGDQGVAWETAMTTCESEYFSMLNSGASPQIARSVLPNSLKTELVMTCNFREWKHFLRLRESPAAHPQMREVAAIIGSILREKFPSVFPAMETP